MYKQNYGNYTPPEKLIQLIELQQRLEAEKLLPYGDLLGLYFGLEHIENRYMNTPLDAISFARPGIDGIHYAFLTDFGTASTLNEAFIIRVSPMDFEQPVQLVAHNLKDFINLLFLYTEHIHELHAKLSFKRLNEIEQQSKTENDPLKVQEQLIYTAYETCFQPVASLNFVGYYEQLQKKREQMTITSNDGLGVVAKQVQPVHKFVFCEEQDLTIDGVDAFFQQATYEEKLLFFREAQSLGLICSKEIKGYLKNELISMQLNDEARRMMYP